VESGRVGWLSAVVAKEREERGEREGKLAIFVYCKSVQKCELMYYRIKLLVHKNKLKLQMKRVVRSVLGWMGCTVSLDETRKCKTMKNAKVQIPMPSACQAHHLLST